jgi:hypothetical protein
MANAQELPQACGMECAGCQTEIPISPGESVGFRDVCDRCRADLHVCLCCAHDEPSSYNECREPNAERVLDRDRANRCEYFRPREGGGRETSAGRQAISDLENLFKKD